MMISNELFLAGLLLVLGFLSGYLTRSLLAKSNKKRLRELEQTMLNDHAEILQLHQEKAILQQQLKESRIPVITMGKPKDPSAEENLAKQAN